MLCTTIFRDECRDSSLLVSTVISLPCEVSTEALISDLELTRASVDVLQTHCRPRPELDIDLIPAYLSFGNSEAGAKPVGLRLRADEDCAVGS